jgi:orotate phosphoribosyltransferase
MNQSDIIHMVKSCVKIDETGDGFVLSSGRRSSWYCDLVHIRWYFSDIVQAMSNRFLVPFPSVVGVALGGALLTAAYAPRVYGIAQKKGERYEIYLPYNCTTSALGALHVVLIDDVVTTETTFKCVEEALLGRGVDVSQRCVVLDRRRPEDCTLKIDSLVTAKDLGLEL